MAIKKVDLSIFGTVILKEVQIRDHHQDTLIFVDKIRTSLFNAKRILENNIQLRSASFKGVHVNVKKYKDEETHNLSIFIDKFKDDNLRGTRTKSFQIKSSNIYLEDINYKQINENKAVPLDFAAYSGGGSIEDFSILGPDIALNVKGFYFIDNKGIEVTNFSTDFRYTKNQMQFHNTTLQTPFSKINVALDFHYDSRDPVKFNELIYLEATFIDSHLSTKDLRKRYSEIKGNDLIRFDSSLKGSLNNLFFQNLMLESDNGIRIRGDLNLLNTLKKEKFSLTAALKEFTASCPKLKEVMPNLMTNRLPEELIRLGEFSFSGITEVTPTKIRATLDIQSELGEMESDLELINFDDIDDAAYTGQLVLNRFHLGKFLNDNTLGTISFEGRVDGTGFRAENINTKLVGRISQIEFNDYHYQNILVNGLYRNHLFDGKLAFSDANLNGTFQGLADLSDEVKKFDFKLILKYANLKAIKLYTRDSIAELKGSIDLDLKGSKLDNIEGIINFKNIVFTNEKTSYPFNQFLIFSTLVNGIRQIRVDSEDIIKGELIGNFKFKELFRLTQNALGGMYANYTPFEVAPSQFLKFNFLVYDQIVEVFFPKISVSPNTRIDGRIEADTDQLKLKITSPKITAYGNVLDSISLDTDNKRKLYDTSLSIKSLQTPHYKLSKLLLFNKTINDTSFFKSTFKGGNFEKEKFNLDFYYTINKEQKSVLGIEETNFDYRGKLWSLYSKNKTENKIVFDVHSDTYEFYPFKLRSDEQEINFKGILKDSTFKNLQVDFSKVYLSSFLPVIDSLKLRGKLDGTIHVSQKAGIYDPKGSLKIKNFTINDFKQGNLSLNLEGRGAYDQYRAVLSLEREKAKRIAAQGTLNFSKKRPEIDLVVDLEEFELSAFSPLGENVLSKIRGVASGNFTLKGFLRNPDMNGSLILRNAGLQFPYLNIDYNFDGSAIIGLNGQSFEFDTIHLRDSKYQTTGILQGAITHQNFDQWALDIDILSPNLLVLDTDNSPEALYYGTGFIEGKAKISGLTNNIMIDVSAKTMPNTDFVIPLKEIAFVDSYKLIHFKSEKSLEELQKNVALERMKGVNLNLDLEISKDAKAHIIIDEQSGSELSGIGSGDLQIVHNKNKKFAIFGQYTIESGIYTFKYGGLLNKPFKISRGGTISWSGDPYDANIDVEAIYTTNASPAVLLENFSSNRKIPVDLITNISGSLFNSEQEFDIEIQNSNSTVAAELDFILNDNDLNSKMRHFLTLLVAGTFANPSGGSINGGELLTGTTSSAIGSIISDVISSNKVRLDLGYSAGGIQMPQDENLYTDDQFDVSVTAQFNKKIIVNGKVGVPVGAQAQSSVVGEVLVEVLLNEAGNFRSIIFNRQNEVQYSAQEEGYTQGIGLSYQVNFNSLSELLKKTGLKRKHRKDKKPKRTTE